MSTSRDSRIGLPLSSDSSTASSRERSWISRAIRNRYFARSRPLIGPQTLSNALRAERTALSTSAGPASLTSASTSSDAGETVLNGFPSVASVNWPLMKSPYDDLMSTMARDSGAGAYSNLLMVNTPSVQREVVGAGVVPGGQLGALHQQVVQQAGRTEAEQFRVQPVRSGRLVDRDQELDRILRGPDPAGRLDADVQPRGLVVVPDRLQHHQRRRQRGRGGHLAGGGLDEARAGQHRQPGRPPDVVVGDELAGLQDHLEVRVAGGLADRGDLVEDEAVPAGEEGAAVDHHVDLVGAG